MFAGLLSTSDCAPAGWNCARPSSATADSERTPAPPLAVKWRRDVGPSVTAPLRLADSLLFVGTGDGALKVLDVATGRPCGELAVHGAAVHAAAAVTATHLVVAWLGADQTVRGVERRTGQRLWSRDVGDCSTTPVVADGRAVVGAESGAVLALDLVTGDELWRASVAGRVRSGLAVVDGVVVVGDGGGSLRAFTLEDGDGLWSLELGASVRSRIAVLGDAAFVATVAGEVWSVEVKTGALRWRTRVTEAAVRAGPVVAGSRVIVGTDDRRVVALDADRGTVTWEASVGGVVRGAPAVGGDFVYVAAGDGSLAAFTLADGRELWQTHLSAPVLTDLTIGYGGLFAGADDGNVYRFSPVHRSP